MATDYNITDFENQMKSFQASDEARQSLFMTMLDKYTILLEEHANLKNDYASERDIRRNYQKSVDQMQKQVSDAQRELESNSFVLALIDGDGVIFQDALLQLAASDGGSEAASRLQHAIREHIASLYDNSSNWPIMVQIYVSLDRLAMKLASVGLLSQPQEFRAFAQGFSVNQPLFSIIDVGHGKERVDHKIKEMLRTFSSNPTCKHIVFGGCHDAGYLLNLDQYKHDADKAARITLLESRPAFKGFTNLPNFQRARFDLVFRRTPVPDSYSASIKPQAQPPAAAISQHLTRTLTNGSSGPVTANATPTTTSPSTTVSSLATPALDPEEITWATVGKGGVTNENISIAPKANPKKKWIYYNEQGQRLDEPLPPRDPVATKALDQRMQRSGRRLCNNFHLNKGKCHSGTSCFFQHEPKLTSQERTALRHKAKSLACKNRACENIDCYLSHQCSLERDQGACPYPDTCHLRYTHGMDKVKYLRWDGKNNEEIIGK